MQVIRSISVMQALARRWQRRGTASVSCRQWVICTTATSASPATPAEKRVGKAGKVVVSIYVNPTQFAPTEDLSRYPRDLKRDSRSAAREGVDVVFVPSDAEMYPGKAEGNQHLRRRGNARYPMEGASRPTHFRGVTTVVAKLFNIVLPDLAVFGAKDWQQAAIIKRMVADLNFPLKIIVAPTMREADGVAMSSAQQIPRRRPAPASHRFSRSIAMARKLSWPPANRFPLRN